jgi:hypothetical protein
VIILHQKYNLLKSKTIFLVLICEITLFNFIDLLAPIFFNSISNNAENMNISGYYADKFGRDFSRDFRYQVYGVYTESDETVYGNTTLQTEKERIFLFVNVCLAIGSGEYMHAFVPCKQISFVVIYKEVAQDDCVNHKSRGVFKIM